MKSYVAYIRVSTVKQGEHGSSLQEQRTAIEAYAARHDLTIAQWYEEVETAAKQGRHLFNRMLQDVIRRRATGVIIHKIDRSARNLKDWARLGELIDSGLEIHFAHESLDLGTRGGRLAADIQAVVAADFIRNLREETRKGFYGRLRQGLYPLAAPRGYLDCGRGKPKAIDPIEGPLIREAFELYAAGNYGIDALRTEMRRRGLCTAGGGKLSRHGIANILHNPFYVGIIKLRKTAETFAGKHEPLISTALFNQVQAIIEGRVFTRQAGDPVTFRRLLKCAQCSLSLIGERQKGSIYYRCHSPSCRGTCMRADAVEEAVQTSLARLKFRERDLREVRDQIRILIEQDRANADTRIERIARDIALLEERQHRLTDALLDGTIERDEYHARKNALLWQKRQLEEQRALGGSGWFWAQLLGDIELGNSALMLYNKGNSEERREILKSLTSNLVACGKNVVFPMRSPLAEVRDWSILKECDPRQPHPRNNTASSAAQSSTTGLLAQFAKMKPRSKDARNSPRAE